MRPITTNHHPIGNHLIEISMNEINSINAAPAMNDGCLVLRTYGVCGTLYVKHCHNNIHYIIQQKPPHKHSRHIDESIARSNACNIVRALGGYGLYQRVTLANTQCVCVCV